MKSFIAGRTGWVESENQKKKKGSEFQKGKSYFEALWL